MLGRCLDGYRPSLRVLDLDAHVTSWDGFATAPGGDEEEDDEEEKGGGKDEHGGGEDASTKD